MSDRVLKPRGFRKRPLIDLSLRLVYTRPFRSASRSGYAPVTRSLEQRLSRRNLF